jgi:hypothetical protein
MSGRGDRIRTCDLMLPKHARYQLRYTPMWKDPQVISSRTAPGQGKEQRALFLDGDSAAMAADLSPIWVFFCCTTPKQAQVTQRARLQPPKSLSYRSQSRHLLSLER